jgi:hypothetical protein
MEVLRYDIEVADIERHELWRVSDLVAVVIELVCTFGRRSRCQHRGIRLHFPLGRSY